MTEQEVLQEMGEGWEIFLSGGQEMGYEVVYLVCHSEHRLAARVSKLGLTTYGETFQEVRGRIEKLIIEAGAQIPIAVASELKSAVIGLGFGFEPLGIAKTIGVFLRYNKGEFESIKRCLCDYIMEHQSVGDAPMFQVAMPCGNSLIFWDYDDVMGLMEEDIPCPCGDPTHEFLKCEAT